MPRRYRVIAIILGFIALVVSAGAIVLSHDAACGAPPALAGGTPTMRAMVYRCYGSPAVVKLESIAKPLPAPNRVLVKVLAASVNPLDWHYVQGRPYFVRAMVGVGTPDDIHLGVDFAGIVEAVGQHVTHFKPGDAVFGAADGSFAEYVSVREAGSLALKPQNVTFQQAAAVPIAAVTALQALRDKGQVRAGERVLINGASGGVGTYAVQIAKAFGAEVTGVCSTRNLGMVRAIGADHVIDYTREDFTKGSERYDLIIDNVASHSFAEYRRVLTPSGRMVAVGGINCGFCMGPLFAWLGETAASSIGEQKRLSLLAEINGTELTRLAELMRSGKLTSVIDRTYPLGDVPAAIGYLEQGHARGKVIIDVATPREDGPQAVSPSTAATVAP